VNAAARGPRKAAASGAPEPAPLSAKVRGLGVAVVCLTSLAQLARALVRVDDRSLWPWYLGLGAAYMALFAFTVMRPPGRRWQAHVLLAGQCLIVLALLSLEHHQDFMTGLFVPIALEAALLFAGRETWTWVAVLAALIVGSLMFYLEPLEGLSQALASLALEIVLAAYVVVAREIESARRRSQVMLEELQAVHGRLQAYAAQAGELAALAERHRVARDLNESVAASVAGVLEAAAAARAVLASAEDGTGAETGPDDAARAESAAPLLAALQADTQAALAQMRGLIAELRPKGA
jgi:signal transduction histidine kinase